MVSLTVAFPVDSVRSVAQSLAAADLAAAEAVAK
jgi:hypothetical protein